MADLQTRLAAFLTALGADMKANKINGSPGMQFACPVGWYTFPDIRSSGGAVQVQNRLQFQPIFLNPGTYDGFTINRTTASAGGAGIAFLVGLYGLNSDGLPNTGSAPLISGSFTTLNATGIASITTGGTTVVDRPAQFYIASIYTYTTVPTTAPGISCIAGGQNPPAWSTWASPGNSHGYFRSGYTALPTADQCTTANVSLQNSNDMPIIGVHRSA